MKRFFMSCGAAFAALLLVLSPGLTPGAQAQEGARITTLADLDPDYEYYPLPPGEGVEEVYFACIACHSLRTVTNGGYSRRVWNELLDWMVEDQGMMEPEPEIRAIILDYLTTHLDEDWQG